MVKKLQLNLIKLKFKEDDIFLFRPFDLQKFFNVSPNTASLFLNRNVKKGYLKKIRKGLYCFSDSNISEFYIANKAYIPSYVSFEYALMYYNIISETVYGITSATSKTSKNFLIRNINYSYYRIKKEAFTGYIKKDFDGQISLIAEPEKALADYFYFVSIGKKALYDRLNLDNLEKNKLIQYAKLFKRKNLLSLIDKIYANYKRNRQIIY